MVNERYPTVNRFAQENPNYGIVASRIRSAGAMTLDDIRDILVSRPEAPNEWITAGDQFIRHVLRHEILSAFNIALVMEVFSTTQDGQEKWSALFYDANNPNVEDVKAAARQISIRKGISSTDAEGYLMQRRGVRKA